MRDPSNSNTMPLIAMICWVMKAAGSNAVGCVLGVVRPMTMLSTGTARAAPFQPYRQVSAAAGSANSSRSVAFSATQSAGS